MGTELGNTDGKQCKVVVNIGAERTFVRKGLFKKELLKHLNPLQGSSVHCRV